MTESTPNFGWPGPGAAPRTGGPPVSRRAAVLAIAAMIGLLAVLAIAGAAGLFIVLHERHASHILRAGPAATLPTTAPARTLVYIVPGTYGNAGDWPMLIAGKATFGSELQRALGPRDVVYPFVWRSSVEHAARSDAADQLARDIDQRSAGFSRVVLVAHSHGGNVALLAAGRCHRHIDSVFCLSTPHIYVALRGPRGAYAVPVYCSPQAWQNIGDIVTLTPTSDDVPDSYAGLEPGLTENEALGLCTGWRDQLGNPRLADDGNLFTDLLESRLAIKLVDNLAVSSRLNCAKYNVVYYSQMPARWSNGPHGAGHSRRMGAMLGGVIRHGVSAEEVAYLHSFMQLADEDDGGPTPLAPYLHALEQHAQDAKSIGWVLRKVHVDMPPEATTIADDLDGSPPDPYLEMTSVSGRRVLGRTPVLHDTITADWSPGWLLPRGQGVQLALYDDDFFGRDALGARSIDPTTAPPSALATDSAHHIYWSATLDWLEVHH